MANHKAGRPWADQFPRRADGGWESTDVRGMLTDSTEAVLAAERMSQPGFDPKLLHSAIMHAMSCLQEADDMLAERYVLDRDVEKAGFIKENKDMFTDPTPFLEEE